MASRFSGRDLVDETKVFLEGRKGDRHLRRIDRCRREGRFDCDAMGRARWRSGHQGSGRDSSDWILNVKSI